MDQKSLNARSLVDMGVLDLDKGEIEQAAKKFNEVLVLGYEEIYAIYGLGKVAYHQGDFSSARRCFIEAIEKSPGADPFMLISGLALEAQALEALAFLAASQDQMKRAARLLGATEDFHQKFLYTRTSRERAERTSAIATVREALGEEGFAKAWEEGKAMTQEQAVAYAKEVAYSGEVG